VEYKLLEAKNDIGTFQAMVTEHLADGWKLVGGVAVVCAPDTDPYAGWWFYQAMVKHAE
jgi:hypothetical protein